MKFFKSEAGEYINVEHVVRFYVEQVKMRHDENYEFVESEDEKLLCYALYAVTTENIWADFYQPMLVGYFKDVEGIEGIAHWINALPDPYFMPKDKITHFLPLENRNPPKENHVLEQVSYHRIKEV